MNIQDTVSRWDAFLAKIKSRCQAILAQTEEASLQLIDPATLDTTALVNAWSAIELQLIDLSSQVDETWGNKVSETLVDAGCGEEVFFQQGMKRYNIQSWIERQREEMEIHIFAQAAKVILQRARELLAKSHPCTQCSAPLPIPQTFFRSSHVVCTSCQTVNTFEPGGIVRAVEGFCVDHLAKQATKELYFHWLECEKQMNEKENAAATQAAETALRQYTEAFLRERIKLVPELEENYEKDLQGKMSLFYYVQDRLRRALQEHESTR